jgi:tetratricopeptide (TPR) repeat protein
MFYPRSIFFLLFLILYAQMEAQMHFDFYQMAKMSKKNFDYCGAIRMLNKANEMAPNEGEYYVDRGHIYLGSEKTQKANQDFNTAMSIDSLDIEPWIGKSLCHTVNNELDAALVMAQVDYILAESQYEQARAGSLLGEAFLSK